MAAAYRDRILAALPAGARFEPLMTLYLTDTTSPQEIRAAQRSGFIFGAKLYPAGATTHSDAGVTAIEKIYPALEAMQDCGLVFQVHGEVTDADVDVFDRERVFIDRILAQVVERFPSLRIVFEHVTTREAVQFVKGARARRRRDDHAAAPAAESQCDLPGRHPPAPLLPAGAQARARSRRR